MTHQKWSTKLMGMIVPRRFHTCIDTNGSYASCRWGTDSRWHQAGRQLFWFSIKLVPFPAPPPPKKNSLHPTCLIISLVSFKEIKVSICYMDGKEPRFFFSLTLTVHGKMYFSFENIWKECFQVLGHCALFTSQMLSQNVFKLKRQCLCV